MVTWQQIYSPVLGNLFLSAAVAALPVVVLLGLLAFFEVKAYLAALSGLVAAMGVAFFIYHMPGSLVGMAAVQGAVYGLLPIGWIVINAIFVYDLTVKSGDFAVVKDTIAGLAADRRIQALIIAFCFGSFLEGAAGFGTPVAICAAMLIGLGFKPLQAAGLSLIGNTAPVAFGALGTPVVVLAAVTGLPLHELSATIGRILFVFSILVPFWLVWVMAGRKAMLEVWPACLTAGLSFGVVQLLVSNLHGPWVVAIAASIASLLSMVALLKFWKPAKTYRFESEKASAAAVIPVHGASKAVKAWMPWIFLSLFVFAWGLPQVKTALDGGSKTQPNLLAHRSYFEIHVPLLDKAVIRTPPVVPVAKAEDAIYKLNWLSATGTSLLLAGILGGLFMGFKPRQIAGQWFITLNKVKISLLTISAMLALGFTTKSSGLDATVGLAFAATGALFPFFSAMLGWLGVALTGSDTSSNVLFGGLQKITAQQLGINPILTASANSAGGVMGKMIDAQSLVVASIATNQQGEEGSILRFVFWHSLSLAGLVGLSIFLCARVFPWVVPSMPASPAVTVTAAPAAAAPAAPVAAPVK